MIALQRQLDTYVQDTQKKTMILMSELIKAKKIAKKKVVYGKKTKTNKASSDFHFQFLTRRFINLYVT